MSGSIEYYVRWRWRGYPFKLFVLLDPSQDTMLVADEILSDCKHLYDPFTMAWVTVYNTVALLTSIPALTALWMVGVLKRLITARIECRHALIRMLLLMKMSTRGADLASLSSDFILTRQRALQHWAMRLQQVFEAEDEPSNGPMRGGGGACRALMREWLSSQEASELSSSERFVTGLVKYRECKRVHGEANDAVWQRYEKQGHLMSLTVQAKRAQKAIADNNPLQVSSSQPVLSSPVAAAAQSAVVPFDGDAAISMLESEHYARASQACQAAVRRSQYIKASELRAGEVLLARHVEVLRNRGVSTTDIFTGFLPCADALLGSRYEVRRFHWSPDVARFAETFLTSLTFFQKELVATSWTQKAQPRSDDGRCGTHSLKQGPASRSTCFYAGRCVCNEPALRVFVSYLQKALRRLFHKGNSSLAVLLEGLAVLEVKAEDDTPGMFFHISHEDRTTWRCALLPGKLDVDSIRMGRAAAHDTVALVFDSLGFMRLWDAFRHVAFGKAWHAQVHTLVLDGTCSHDDAAFSLQHQVVAPLDGYSDAFWPGLHNLSSRDKTQACQQDPWDAAAAKRRRQDLAAAAPIADNAPRPGADADIAALEDAQVASEASDSGQEEDNNVDDGEAAALLLQAEDDDPRDIAGDAGEPHDVDNLVRAAGDSRGHIFNSAKFSQFTNHVCKTQHCFTKFADRQKTNDCADRLCDQYRMSPTPKVVGQISDVAKPNI